MGFLKKLAKWYLDKTDTDIHYSLSKKNNKELFKEGLKNLREARKLKIQNEKAEFLKQKERASIIHKIEKNSCDGCIFLISESVVDDADISIKWRCCKYNKYLKSHAFYPKLTQHLSECKYKHISQIDPERVVMF